MHGCLAEQNIEIVGSGSAIAGTKHENIFTLVPLQRECHAACERTERGDFTEGRENAVALAAIMGWHIATCPHRTGCTRVCFTQWAINITRALEPGAQVAIVERKPVRWAEGRDNRSHTFMSGAANIKRKTPLRLARFQ